MDKLNFYDVDNEYIQYLKNIEIKTRGFTCVPDIIYLNEKKFLCGVVLEINNFKYYVPVTSYKKKQSENVLIEFPKDKTDKIKGSLRFNFMFPVPDNMIKPRIIKSEIDEKRRIFLYEQLKFCNKNYDIIIRQAKRTYTIITKKLNLNLLKNSCDFKLLEEACIKWEKQ